MSWILDIWVLVVAVDVVSLRDRDRIGSDSDSASCRRRRRRRRTTRSRRSRRIRRRRLRQEGRTWGRYWTCAARTARPRTRRRRIASLRHEARHRAASPHHALPDLLLSHVDVVALHEQLARHVDAGVVCCVLLAPFAVGHFDGGTWELLDYIPVGGDFTKVRGRVLHVYCNCLIFLRMPTLVVAFVNKCCWKPGMLWAPAPLSLSISP